MFGSKSNKNNESRNIRMKKEHAVTILTEGCHFVGKLYCRGTSRIGGQIEGEIISEGKLILEETSKVDATVQADDAVIQGQISGKLNAKERVELTATSKFNGEIVTASLIIREGAQFNGRAKMGKQEPVPLANATVNKEEKAPKATLREAENQLDHSPEIAVMKDTTPVSVRS